ncbi:hypothetical protein, conserved [Eimeria tenella]|uniref:Uncharacterized protein n=1 Tax=Eimeria tenella TaxID=5802 RepID=U6KGS7_EIMTE|nr:hypothetical protein, conserved [Eimeria tenella]CDJ37154.1 hypothetical protein, conserved [Eimeria tenella]|eukprot:XP_013227992.1 hypothetical protein, conserved [Eimeria tenella]
MKQREAHHHQQDSEKCHHQQQDHLGRKQVETQETGEGRRHNLEDQPEIPEGATASLLQYSGCPSAAAAGSSSAHRSEDTPRGCPTEVVSLSHGTLLIWAPAGSESAGPTSAVAEAESQSYPSRAIGKPCADAGYSPSAPHCFVPLRPGAALNLSSVLQQQLMRQQQHHARVSSTTIVRQVLLAEERRAAFFAPQRLPLILYLSSYLIPAKQRQNRIQNEQIMGKKIWSNGKPHVKGALSSSAATQATPEAAAASTEVIDAAFLASLLWAVASWFSRLAELVPVSAEAATAALGLCTTTSARAAALAAADGCSEATAVPSAASATLQLYDQPCAVPAQSLAAGAVCLQGGISPRLAALRAVAYWCCCCTLAEQEATHEMQRKLSRKQQRQQNESASSGSGSTEALLENSNSSSTTLLRQLHQECSESFAQLLLQQREAQQHLAERQGIEMEAACALREKQEQALQAAVAARAESGEDPEDVNETAVVAAAAALTGCEKGLQELVQQHLSECELLDRHWKHEQQLLRQQQLRMFKDVAADLYLLQHGSAALFGAARQGLVLPPLPSSDETDTWAFSWQQQEQPQEHQLHGQHEQRSWRQVGEAARQLFKKGGSSYSLEGFSLHTTPVCKDFTVVAAGVADAVAEEQLYNVDSGAARPKTAAGPVASILGLVGAAASGRYNGLQQQQKHQQKRNVAHTVHKGEAIEEGHSAQVQLKEQQQQKQQTQQGSTSDLNASVLQPQQSKPRQRQLAAAAAAHQGPVFDMPRLLQGITGSALPPQQRRIAALQQQHQQSKFPRHLGGVQEHAQLRLIIGAQQRRTFWLHVCTGVLADFFPSKVASASPVQQQSRHGDGSFSCAGQWLSMLGRGDASLYEGPAEGWAGGFTSYCYRNVRDMRVSPHSYFSGGTGRLSCGEPSSRERPEGPFDHLFAALERGPQASLSGAVLPTGPALQESSACIRARNDAPDLLLPSLEEQKRLLRAAVDAVRPSSVSHNGHQRLLLQQGEVFVSRHVAGLRPQICFHLVASARQDEDEPQTPSAVAPFGETPVRQHSLRRANSYEDEIDSLSAPLCQGLRQILRLCEAHAVEALLLPLLLLETEASASCLPFVLLQRRMLAALRCIVAELRSIALSPLSSSNCCSSDMSVDCLRHIVLLLPPMQQQQEGSMHMSLLVQAELCVLLLVLERLFKVPENKVERGGANATEAGGLHPLNDVLTTLIQLDANDNPLGAAPLEPSELSGNRVTVEVSELGG